MNSTVIPRNTPEITQGDARRAAAVVAAGSESAAPVSLRNPAARNLFAVVESTQGPDRTEVDADSTETLPAIAVACGF